jgi:hypothetical protein
MPLADCSPGIRGRARLIFDGDLFDPCCIPKSDSEILLGITMRRQSGRHVRQWCASQPPKQPDSAGHSRIGFGSTGRFPL